MYLLAALKITSAEDVDPSRPLQIGSLKLGEDAASEASRILAGGEFPRDVNIDPRGIVRPFYWAIAHKTEGDAEVFGFPSYPEQELPTAIEPPTAIELPTAIEIALIRALAASKPDQHAIILAGGVEVSIGPDVAAIDFRKIIRVIDRPMAGDSFLYNGATQAIISENASTLLNGVVLSCLANSFRTSPLKFRFLELYRVMEARFLAEIKVKLMSSFDAEPSAALSVAVESLKSEMKQIICLAETQKDAFEACWNVLDQINNVNQFTTALFRRIAQKGNNGGKWATGAALVYQMRCAIVHAGEKDMIFENFQDGEDALKAVIPHVERAALLLIGVDLS